MTVPLDRLYHYIESVAEDIRGDAVIIYRFTPHGSKKIGDLRKLRNYLFLEYATSPHMYCNDQEPLDYEYYQNIDIADHPDAFGKRLLRSVDIESPNTNFQLVLTMFDKALLLHSEERSVNLEKYRAGPFVPVYYWSHAIISLDWFRYAQYINQSKQVTKKFLVYNRAWSGTREYRLKFIDLLIDNNLQTECLMTFNSVEPELHIHYTEHEFINIEWAPTHKLEDYFDKNIAPSHASADFDLADYQATDFEVVLETLFDDERLQLTEKVLRPIAVGQPFLHIAPHGSLKYLQRYGFKTFGNIIDESYDTIKDPAQRLRAVVNVMITISKWSDQEREEKMLQIKNIVDYNKDYFFSNKFFNLVVNELKTNLQTAFEEQESSNTGNVINWRKKLSQHQEVYNKLVGIGADPKMRKEIATFIKHTRKYYLKKH
jgi:hypothetical protein